MRGQLYTFVNGHPFHEDDGVREFMTGSEIAGLVGIAADTASVRRDIKIDPKDLRVDTYQPSKSLHETATPRYAAVRFTHIPTRIKVSSHVERSQIRNRAEAVRTLRERLLELGYAKPHPIGTSERVRMENGDSFIVTAPPASS